MIIVMPSAADLALFAQTAIETMVALVMFTGGISSRMTYQGGRCANLMSSTFKIGPHAQGLVQTPDPRNFANRERYLSPSGLWFA